jgi:membrane-bound ClpP family serine protease
VRARALITASPDRCVEAELIILGIILVVLGLVVPAIHVLLWVGIVILVIGAVLALLGMAGREVGGRRHYY